MPSAGNCIGLYAQLACIWEATARKPGNVHRYQDFADMSYVDFLLSAAAIAPILDRADSQRVGMTVLEGVRATRRLVNCNTNLGILLLLAPLAAVPPDEDLRAGVERILSQLDVADSRAVYEAIRLANPGGLGQTSVEDVRDEPTLGLRQIMALAGDRDLVARQYANGFREVFDDGLAALERALAPSSPTALPRSGGEGRFADQLESAIIRCHVELLAKHPDSLITRKCGHATAEEASRRAQQALDAGFTAVDVAELDAWLRADGQRRNPGTTADLVTACLFAALRQSGEPGA
jgi:triphosphoribosyl-dephospho-CoA synthase